MTVHAKSALILLATFVLGAVVGVLIDRTYNRVSWEKRVSRWSQPETFGRYFERIIRPTPDQKKQIQEVVSRYSKEIAELSKESRQAVREKMKAMRTEIDSLLTEEQRERLERHFEKMRERSKRSRRKYPPRDRHEIPPPDQPPPEHER